MHSGTFGGCNHAIKGEIIIDWDEALKDEQYYDGNLLIEWEFVQDGVLNENCHIDKEKKETFYDLSKKSKHPHNQFHLSGLIKGRRLSKDRK